MMLYHTSYMVVEQPDLEHSREYLDFGKGFYLTSLRHQAVLYSERFFFIDLYFTGDISKDEALKRLKYEKPNNQYCLRTQRAIDLLPFKSAEEIIK